ncbi:DNA repair protein RecN [Agaricicola taiwanensis]|uniref:DNA repair protein RecN n=1 Tax=Agaricicola taiwanensis TaxID=591372 RepID=A0A8J2YEJ2_9RHOB|nr:DNA repair protein RecN [Agaricicola taiwanensis]GGE42417.1 DNA repair protein RecN [Agaricicola taiwanensis]
MLVQLSVRDIVLIDRLDLSLEGGLTVLTGETGAGKSILLDSLALALGGRGDAGLVRSGCEQGHVTAVFDLPVTHPARHMLVEQDLPDEGDLVVRRTQFIDGRTRAFINDQPVSVQLLRSIGATLVEIHGQHADRAFVDPAAHRSLLDAFGGHQGEAEEVARLWSAWKGAERAEIEHRAKVTAARAEADFLRHAQEELTKLAPEAGEEAQLAERRHDMMQAEKIAQDLAEVAEAIAGPNSPTLNLSSAVRRLERRGVQAPNLVEPIIAAMDAAMLALDEAAAAVTAAQEAAKFDPRELERIEERLFALRAAARKYDVLVDDLPVAAARFGGELAALDAGEERLRLLEDQTLAAQIAFRKAAAALTERRQAASTLLDKAVNAELPDLKLERARFVTSIESEAGSSGPHGNDRVEFWVQTNPGTRPGPMLKVASGGELARFLLALKVALVDRGSAPTLIFDEIDTGVGGAVADAIGQRLARLAGAVQVIAVTHAPQVAARAANHLLIAKDDVSGGERVATRVVVLEEDARKEELARMLAGASVTDEARAAAARLLHGAV